MKITDSVKYVGVNDTDIALFEGQYVVPNGISYNSYVILDEKIAVMDSVDARYGNLWLENVEKSLGERTPDYLVVHHMEPDHSASIVHFAAKYPDAKIVSSAKAEILVFSSNVIGYNPAVFDRAFGFSVRLVKDL